MNTFKLFIVLSLWMILPVLMYGQDIPDQFKTFNTNGTVNDMEYDEANDLLYVAGFFSRVGHMTRFGAAVASDGTEHAGYPEVNGIIRTVVPDGSGGFFIGGDFTEVGGVTRNRLAQIDVSGNLTSWDPNANYTVRELFLVGGTLYVGGSFSNIGGASRDGLAAVDASTGAVSSWDVVANTQSIYSLHVKDGIVYVGGGFSTIGGQSRNRLAAIDASTGLATSWNPNLNNRVEAIEITDNTIYVGGLFTSVGGVSHGRLAAFDLSTGNQISWDPAPNSTVYDIVVDNTTLYVSGAFSTISGVSRARIASYVETTKEINSFSIPATSTVDQMIINGNTMYIAAPTNSGQVITGVSAIDLTDDSIIDTFDAACNGDVYSVAISGGKIYIGGNIYSVGGTIRNNLACIDVSTGQLTSWNPSANGTVAEIILDGSYVYAGGSFTEIGGIARDRIAKIQKSTAGIDAFNPAANSSVLTMELQSGILYVGGGFTTLGGASRSYIGAVDASTGNVTSWNPNSNHLVETIRIANSTAYIGGRFTTMGGQSRGYMASTDLVNGSLNAWNPSANNSVWDMEFDNSGDLLVGGSFTSIGGQSRNRIASLDASTGNALSWNPSSNNAVVEIEVTDDGTVYVGGNFSNIGGSARARMAAFAPDGTLTSWTSDPNSSVSAYETAGLITFAGGSTNFYHENLNYVGFIALDRSNSAAYDISIDNSTIAENQSSGAVVGNFSSEDDEGDTHTYALVSGDGDVDNSSFSISGAQLLTAEVFDFETQNAYNIRVSSTDNNGYSFEKTFMVSVTNLVEKENDILTFSIPEQSEQPTIDAVSHTVTVVVPFGTDKSSLTPTFTLSSGASASPTSGAAQNFTSDVTYTVTAENGSGQDWTVTVLSPLPAGDYTVGSGGDYNDLSEAISDLNSNGIGGDINLLFLDGHTEGSVAISGGWYGEGTYQVTIMPEDGASSVAFSAASSVWTINELNNVVFDGKGITTLTATNSVASVITFLGSSNSQNLVFKNLIMTSTSGNAMWIRDSDEIEVSGCSYSFGGAIPDQNILVFRINSGTNVQYIGNHIVLGSQYNSAIRGITVFYSSSDTYMANNIIHASPTSAAIFTGMTSGGIFYHNTMVLDGPGSIDNVMMVRNNSSVGSTVVNNLLYLDITHTTGVGVTTSNVVSTITNNNFYIPAADGVSTNYLNINGTTYGPSELAAMQSAYPGSTVVQPLFTDASSNDFSLSGASLTDPALRGEPVGTVDEDFDGTARSSSAPNKGAYETPNVLANILDISFTGQQGDEVIDDVNKTVVAVAAANTDVTSLTLNLTTSPGSSVSPTSGNTHDFSTDVDFTVTAEASNQEIWSVSITEFNEIPTDISLSSNTIDENGAVNDVIGTLSTTDANSSQGHTYSLVAGSGDTDNGSFNISGNQLRASEEFDHESKDTYSIRIQTDDGNGGTYAESFNITINDLSEAPTDITIFGNFIDENNTVNDVIGPLSTEDEDEGETYTYTLVAGTGDTDNGSFNINGNDLRASEVFNHENKSSYSVRIQTSDGNGGIYAEAMTITVNDVSENPTDWNITASSIQENNSANDVIGTLSTVDEDGGETYSYTLVSGTGDTDNASFNINGADLRATDVFNFESKDSYSVRIQTDDGNGGQFAKELTISITNEPESPTDIDLSNNSIQESLAIGTLIGTLSTTDPDLAETYTYTLVSGTGDTDNSSFSISGDELLSGEVFDFETKTSYSVRVQTDDGNGNVYSEAFAISISDVGPSITDIGLTNNNFDENNSTPLTIGTFSTIGEEVTGSFSYSLVAGDGDDANSSFFISGDELRTNAVFDHEIISDLSIRVRTDDGMGSFFDKAIAITVNDVNEAPTNIVTGEVAVVENSSIGESVTSFSTDDPDDGDSHTYALVTGDGDDDNSLFTISGNELLAGVVFDFEEGETKTVRVRSTDSGGLSVEESMTVTIYDESETPTDIDLTSASIDENNSINKVLGTFSTTDDDLGETFTYSLVAGSGDADNSSFNINNNELRASESFDFETKNSYSIRIQTDDGNGGTYSESFTVNVNDINEAPYIVDLSNGSIDESNPIGTLVGILSTTDPDIGDTHTYSFKSGNADNDFFTISGNELLSNAVFDYETITSYSLIIISTDAAGLTFEEESFTILINDLPASITALNLDNESIDENLSAGTLVGTLSTEGEDLSGSFTYSLVSGTGDTDNSSFTISGDQVLSDESFNYEVQNSYSIRVNTDDGIGNTQDEILTIQINDILESTDADIEVFSLAEETGSAVIDNINNTVEVEVAYGTDVSALTPTIEVSAGANISPTGAQDFSSPVDYTVTAEEPTVSKVWTVTVTTAPNNATDILSFSLTEETSSANIDAVNHTINVEVADGTDLTSLEPTITVSAGAGISPSGAQDFTSTVTYTVTAEDGTTTQDWMVTVTEEPSIETDILSFSFTEETGSALIDEINHTVGIEVAYGTDLTNLTPEITLSEGASASPTGSQDFTNSVTYTITAEDGITSQDWEVTVTVAPNSETDILTFELSEQTGAATIDAAAHTVAIDVANGTDVSNLTPTITVSAGASIDPSGAQDFSSAVVYTVTAEDGTTMEDWTVTVTEEPATLSDETDILTFEFSEQTGAATIDAAAHTVAIEVINGTDVSNLTPTITVSAGASISPSGAQDFSSAVVYTVTAEDGSTMEDWTVTVTEEPATLSDETDILAFELSEQTGAATIDAVAHTVSIEVVNGTDVTNLTPTITVSAGASISPSGVQDFSSAVIYTVTAEDGSTVQDWTVTVTEEPAALSDETDILAFELSEQTGVATIDAVTHTVSIEVINGTDVTNLTPTIAVSAGASIDPSGAQDFSSAVVYTVTAEDGSTAQDWTVTVTEEPAALNDETDILTFEFSEQTGTATIDAVAHTVSIEVVNGTDVTNLTPTITVSAGASFSPSGAQDFSSAVVYTVTAEDGSTMQDWEVSVMVEEVPMNVDEEAQLTIYPNPAADWVKIEGIANESLSVLVYNMKGQETMRRTLEPGQDLNVRNLDAGVYFLSISGEHKSTTTRLLIRR